MLASASVLTMPHPAATAVPGSGPELLFSPLVPARPLCDFHRFSPPLRGDIGLGLAGLPLRLDIELRDRSGRPVPQAAVYIWHHDPQGWLIELDADDLDTVSRMWGWLFSDARGAVGFRTVYPGQFRDGSVPLYLRIYLHDGEQMTARSDLCLLLPTEVQGPLRPIPVALPLSDRAEPPRFPSGPAAKVWRLPRLGFDADRSVLRAHLPLTLHV